MSTNHSNTTVTRKRYTSMQDLMRVTLEVAKNKSQWESAFLHDPRKSLTDLMVKHQVSIKAARAICDQVGLPRVKYGARKKKQAPSSAVSPERIDQMEYRLNRLSAWCDKLAAELNHPLP